MIETEDFANCVQSLNLTELSWKGEYYSWTNKQLGEARICSRIDRVFGNTDWMTQWGHVDVTYDLPHFSDHCPMEFTVEEIQWKVKVPFRYFNIWAEHDRFTQVIVAAWQRK